MILANTRQHLTRNDAQLAMRVLARGSDAELSELETRLANDGIDAILDDPALPIALVRSSSAAHASLPLFTYVMVRHALRRLGEGDRSLADYLSAIVVHFGMRDRAARVGESDDQIYSALADLLQDVNDPDARRSFLVRAHLGNYALWLSGIFPDFVEQRRWNRGGPQLEYYEEMGRRGFQLAAEHRLAEENGLAPLYAAAADRFGLLRLALNSLSDWLFFPNVHTPERLMRQVADETRWKLAS
ncbi:MAG TPA: hypothetical protein VJW73_17840 [Gemmatimonadaceae bacterium]|nr:hypothetical protein [Gemmatimonadaceae bacterium]